MMLAKHTYQTFCIAAILWCNAAHTQDMSQYGIKKGISMTGGLNFNTVSYQTTDKQSGRRDPFNWFLSGNININAFGYAMPFNFSLSNAGKNYSQPFNRIQFKPYWKWIRGYWGTTSMSFSPLTLNGHLFNGYGVELTRSRWQLAAMYGRLREAVAYDPIIKNTGTVSFLRKGWGVKGGYQYKGDAYSLIFFTAKDDAGSLTFVPQEAQLSPKQNTVIAISIKKRLFKKFNIEAEYALSGITTDATATANKPRSANNFLSFLLPKNGNTKWYDGLKAAFGYTGKWYGLQLGYERIAPEYQTLGAYYFNNDLRSITIAPSVRLFKNKLTISSNIGIQDNNLDKTKSSSTRRWVANGAIAYTPGERWNCSASYSNFTTYTNIRPVNDPFFQNPLDTLNFYQVSSSTSATVTHSFGGKAKKQSLTLNGTYQQAGDQQTGTGNGTTSSRFINGSVAYSLTHTKRGMSLSGSFTYNASFSTAGAGRSAGLATTGTKSIFYGPALNLSQPLWGKKVQASLGASYNNNTTNGSSSSAVWGSRMSIAYAPKPRSREKAGKPGKTSGKPSRDTNSNTTTAATPTTGTTAKAAGATPLVKLNNPLRGKQNMSILFNYMNRLPVAMQRQGFSELTVTVNWSYNF
jgi:hypothetical protein